MFALQEASVCAASSERMCCKRPVCELNEVRYSHYKRRGAHVASGGMFTLWEANVRAARGECVHSN